MVRAAQGGREEGAEGEEKGEGQKERDAFLKPADAGLGCNDYAKWTYEITESSEKDHICVSIFF